MLYPDCSNFGSDRFGEAIHPQDVYDNDDDECSTSSLESIVFDKESPVEVVPIHTVVVSSSKPDDYSLTKKKIKTLDSPKKCGKVISVSSAKTQPTKCFIQTGIPSSPSSSQKGCRVEEEEEAFSPTIASPPRALSFTPSSSFNFSRPRSYTRSFSASSVTPMDIAHHNSLPVAVAIATPVSATRVSSCYGNSSSSSHDDALYYCDSCTNKNQVIKQQRVEIEQLKALVTQMVSVLGKSLEAQHENSNNIHKAEPVSRTLKEDATPAPLGQSDNLVEELPPVPTLLPTSSNDDEHLTSPAPPSQSKDEIGLWNKDSSSTAPSTRTMQRLCQLKHSKGTYCDRSNRSCGKQNVSSVRHVPVTVAQNSGYYSGPSLVHPSGHENDGGKLRGCVVRFDNGDLYLGEMQNFDTGLKFHGRGTLYKKDGTVCRGLFHKNERVE